MGHHALVFGTDTGVAGTKVLFSVWHVLVMYHRVFELSFVYTFHGELDLSRQIFSGKEFCTVGFATKSGDFVTFKLDFKRSGSTFS